MRAVDELVDQVETSELPTLDPDKEQVVYELQDWDDAKRYALSDSLVEAGLAHAFDENYDLVVVEGDSESESGDASEGE